jgi:hypothetical protein
LLHFLEIPQPLDQRLRDRQRLADAHPPRRLRAERDALPDGLQLLLAHPLEARERTVREGFDERFEIDDAGLFPEERERLRPQPGDLQQRQKPRRDTGGQLVAVDAAAGADVVLDHLRAALTDPLDLPELVRLEGGAHVNGHVLEDAPHLRKSDRLERVLPLDLHDRGHLGEQVG